MAIRIIGSNYFIKAARVFDYRITTTVEAGGEIEMLQEEMFSSVHGDSTML